MIDGTLWGLTGGPLALLKLALPPVAPPPAPPQLPTAQKLSLEEATCWSAPSTPTLCAPWPWQAGFSPPPPCPPPSSSPASSAHSPWVRLVQLGFVTSFKFCGGDLIGDNGAREGDCRRPSAATFLRSLRLQACLLLDLLLEMSRGALPVCPVPNRNAIAHKFSQNLSRERLPHHLLLPLSLIHRRK